MTDEDDEGQMSRELKKGSRLLTIFEQLAEVDAPAFAKKSEKRSIANDLAELSGSQTHADTPKTTHVEYRFC